jgi:hypothetical protein
MISRKPFPVSENLPFLQNFQLVCGFLWQIMSVNQWQLCSPYGPYRQTFICSIIFLHLKINKRYTGAPRFPILIYPYSNTYSSYNNSDECNILRNALFLSKLFFQYGKLRKSPMLLASHHKFPLNINVKLLKTNFSKDEQPH